MVSKLRDFIKRIRSCKTAADERAVIAKESAQIRTRFKEDDHDNRHANVAKLLYIHMLGYPAHFGQMECVKLVASPRFADKRLGYLGIMLLLDENQETLTLVTNSLKNDMNHPNMYVVGLALCTLGNTSSVAMARDLCPEVEKLLGSSNSYIRKKAALAAVRIIRKVPDLLDNFSTRCRAMLGERNHGALLTGLTLIYEMCKFSPPLLTEFRGTVPTLVKVLKQLITTGYSPEHDVQGITDPFLQVKVLRLLRLLGKDDATASEQMNDVLAQVASNTDGSKNVGNAILYETVLTILDIQADQTLRVLAISILGRFLSNKDNNIRYVALQTLIRTIAVDVQAVQRHRGTIIECLRDADISIRRRALELAFALVNPSNVRVMTRELLSFLEIADAEFRTSMVTDISAIADHYAPNKRWHLDTLVRVMKLGGTHVRDDIVSQFVRLVTNAPELQGYATHKLFGLLGLDSSQEGLVHAAVWCIGEFGDTLVQPAPLLGGQDVDDIVIGDNNTSSSSTTTTTTSTQVITPSENDVINLLESILIGPYVTPVTKQYILVTLMKLSTQFSNMNTLSTIKSLLLKYHNSMNMELQQRSIEFTNMFSLDDKLRSGLWERMPIQEIKEDKYAANAAAAAAGPDAVSTSISVPETNASTLLDLGLDGLSLGVSPRKGESNNATSPRDLLADIFSTPVVPNVSIISRPITTTNNVGTNSLSSTTNPLADLLGTDLRSPNVMSTISTITNPSSSTLSNNNNLDSLWNRDYPAHTNTEVSVTLKPVQVNDPNTGPIVQVNAIITNIGATSGISDLQLLIAVPKTHKIAMAPISSTTLSSIGTTACQAFRILNPEHKPIKLKLKLVYNVISGRSVDEVTNFAFPDTLL